MEISGSIDLQKNEELEDWEARCDCGWHGTETEGFVHQREHRVAVIFREPRKPMLDSERPPRTVAEAIARSAPPSIDQNAVSS